MLVSEMAEQLGLPAGSTQDDCLRVIYARLDARRAAAAGEREYGAMYPASAADLVEQALADGRIAEASRGRWLAELARDPVGASAQLRRLVPLADVLTPSPSARRSPAGNVLPTGRAARSPVDDPATNPTPMQELAATEPTPYQLALSESTAPTMFVEGDFPVCTASGMDPALIMSLPIAWQAKIACVYAGSPAEVRKIVDMVTGEAGDIEARVRFGDHPMVARWVAAVRRWALGPALAGLGDGGDPNAAYDDLFGADR